MEIHTYNVPKKAIYSTTWYLKIQILKYRIIPIIIEISLLSGGIFSDKVLTV